MSITSEDPNNVIKLGTIHGWIFKASLWVAPLFVLWAVNTIVRHDTDIAVLKMQITLMQNGGKGSVSQSVNVGQAKDAEEKMLTSRDYYTTADVAACEKVSERAVVEWIAQGRIEPAPQKLGKGWVIDRSFRILPQDSANSGTVPKESKVAQHNNKQNNTP